MSAPVVQKGKHIVSPPTVGAFTELTTISKVLVTDFKGDVSRAMHVICLLNYDHLNPPATIASILRLEAYRQDVNNALTLVQTQDKVLEPVSVTSSKVELIVNAVLLGQTLTPGQYKIKVLIASSTVDAVITGKQFDVYVTLK